MHRREAAVERGRRRTWRASEASCRCLDREDGFHRETRDGGAAAAAFIRADLWSAWHGAVVREQRPARE